MASPDRMPVTKVVLDTFGREPILVGSFYLCGRRGLSMRCSAGHRVQVAIERPRAQMEQQSNCTAQRMLGRLGLRGDHQLGFAKRHYEKQNTEVQTTVLHRLFQCRRIGRHWRKSTRRR